MNGGKLKKDWQPTREDFDQFLLRLDSDRESAGERYGKLHRMLTTFFAVRSQDDAPSLADETINRVIYKIVVEQEKVDKLEAYCRGVARNVLRESFRDPQVGNAVPIESLPPDHLPATPSHQELREAEDEAAQSESYLEALRRCLKELPPAERTMIAQYYDGSEEGEAKKHRKEIALRLQIPEGALRSRMGRRRERLRKCVERQLQLQLPHPAQKARFVTSE